MAIKTQIAWILVLVLTLAACRNALVGSDVREIQDDHPVMSDLQIDGATRVGRGTRRGGGTIGGVRQTFEPDDGISLETVADRAIAIAVGRGWDVSRATDLSGWCGSQPRRDPVDGFVNLRIQIREDSSLAVAHVAVQVLLGGRACTQE